MRLLRITYRRAGNACFCFNLNSLQSPTLCLIDYYFPAISDVDELFKKAKDIIINEVNYNILSHKTKLQELLNDNVDINIIIARKFLSTIDSVNQEFFAELIPPIHSPIPLIP